MIYIDPHSPHILKAKKTHLDELFPIIKERVNSLEEGDELKDFLNELRIKNIITDIPEFLERHHNDLLRRLDNHSTDEWAEYVKIKKSNSKTPDQINLCEKYKKLVERIEKIFQYTGGFAKKKKKKYCAYSLAGALKAQTCVYCNRIYTKTVVKPKKSTRPEFDHWFPKENYPILALSFYNLIPSCHICNSSVKGTTVMSLTDFIHPYVDDKINYKFSYWIEKYDKYNFKIIRITPSREDTTIKAFKLEEIYETHRDEIHDLVRIKKIYSVGYLLKMQKMIEKTGNKTSMEELYRLAFGVHYNESDFHKRPLSKMKKDIIEELGLKLT